MGTITKGGAVVVALAVGLGVASSVRGDEAYRAKVEDWRAKRQARLEAKGGWLTLAGLFWLKDGANRFGTDPDCEIVLPEGSAPDQAGVFLFEGGKTALRLASGVEGRIGGASVSGPHVMQPDTSGRPDVLEMGPLSLYVIQRGERYGIRVKDANSPVRKGFTGLKWFDVDEAWRIEARWVSYPAPRPLRVPNVLGEVSTMPSPGFAEFEVDGTLLRLDGVLEDPTSVELFFILRDATSGKETYGAGRFLYADLPRRGRLILDFNKAYNPPCAFTPYATCPLPPKQNWLPVAVEAGERTYEGGPAH
jgi:uncharacterized protein (DUF1684 family)